MRLFIRRFYLAFLVIVFLPTIGIFSLRTYVQNTALLNLMLDQAEQENQTIVLNVENEIAGHSILTASLIYDRLLRNIADTYVSAADSSATKSILGRQMAEHLLQVFVYSNRTGAIGLELVNGESFYYGNSPLIRDHLQISFEDLFKNQSDQVRGKVEIFRFNSLTHSDRDQFMLGGSMYSGVGSASSAVYRAAVVVRLRYLENIMQQNLSDGGQYVLILDDEGLVIFSSSDEEIDAAAVGYHAAGIGAGLSNYQSESRNLHFFTRPIVSVGWNIVSVVDEDFISARMNIYRWLSYPLIILLITFFGIYTMYFSRKVAAPVNALIDSMEVLGRLEKPEPVDTGGVRELDSIIHRFNFMADQIQNLTKEREAKEEARLCAEISALQLQINPHFMANTLNVIRFMALAAGEQNIHDMIQALIRVVSDSYATDNPFTNLAAEMENVRQYVYIMNMRFHGNIELKTSIQPETESTEVLRMMLQPIVENAVIHGLQDVAEGKAVIEISSRIDTDDLLICIHDHGKGIALEVVETLLLDDRSHEDRNRRFNQIGLKNVHDRIRLHFGNSFGLTVQSEPGSGTEICFRLPLRPHVVSIFQHKN